MIYFIFLVLVQNVNYSWGIDLLVETTVGSIRGVSATDGNYSMFMGIPYAQVDHSNPFGVAAPYPEFNETFLANDDSAICPQLSLSNGSIIGSLDCLVMNIYVPDTATVDNPLPVMAFIHGGFFSRGFAGRFSYGPKYLVRHDVILVTFNYRLGPYGFMCLDTPEVPGNAGLKDQVMALQWINTNIKSFGGDVNQITLFGESAGAHSVEFHLTSNKEPLYNKVILQSGTVLARTIFYDPDTSAPLKIAQDLGLETNDLSEAIAYLAKMDSHKVIEASLKLGIEFKPCTEQEFEGVDPFITYRWIDAPLPKVKDMPVLLGFNENELAVGHTKVSTYSENVELIKRFLQQLFNFEKDQLEKLTSVVEHFYFGDSNSAGNTTVEVIAFDSDYTYIHPMRRSITKYLDNGAGNIFHYMFTYIGGTARVANFASHTDERWYIFDCQDRAELRKPEDTIVIDRMSQMWANFAKYSDPTPETTDLLPVKWSPLSNEAYYFMKIDHELSLDTSPLHQRMAFWDLFYYQFGSLQKYLGYCEF